LSLPLVMGTELDTIPATTPYLTADPERAAAWADRLGPRNGPRIGLVWSGGHRRDVPGHWALNRRRNIPAALLAGLSCKGATFFGLQTAEMLADPAEREMARQSDYRDLGPDLADFADTAAVLEHLDLLISVDTAAAHLAGALGRPVWILNRFDSDWRWLDGRDDSPWYPAARLFRQPAPGDWPSVMSAVQTALDAFTPAGDKPRKRTRKPADPTAPRKAPRRSPKPPAG
jgi:hypothetical protein